jgi:Low-density lipoprotein receptor domain class A
MTYFTAHQVYCQSVCFFFHLVIIILFVAVAPATLICSSQMVPCNPEQQCLPLSAICNGQLDCSDGSDELRCPGSKQIRLVIVEADVLVRLRPERGCALIIKPSTSATIVAA